MHCYGGGKGCRDDNVNVKWESCFKRVFLKGAAKSPLVCATLPTAMIEMR